MPVVIITRNTSTAGDVPSTLEVGEMAIDTAEGKLYYGDYQGNVDVLTQKIYVSVAGVPPLNPKEGAIWYQEDVKLTKIYVSSTWEPVGAIDGDGNLSGPFSVKYGGNDLIEASNTLLSGTDPQVQLMNGQIAVDETTGTVTQELTCQEVATFEKAFTVTGESTYDTGDLVVSQNANIRRDTEGVFIHHKFADYPGGAMTFSSGDLPDVNDYEDGDMYFQVISAP